MIISYTNADSSSCPVRQLAPSSPKHGAACTRGAIRTAASQYKAIATVAKTRQMTTTTPATTTTATTTTATTTISTTTTATTTTATRQSTGLPGEAKNVGLKRFEQSNRLDTALYKNYIFTTTTATTTTATTLIAAIEARVCCDYDGGLPVVGPTFSELLCTPTNERFVIQLASWD